MKTLGQILIDEISSREWLREPATTWRLESWEAAAQAVRLAVIEECAQIANEFSKNAKEAPYKSFEDNYPDGFQDAAIEIMWAIRALKDKP